MNINISPLGFGLSSIAGSGNFAHQERLIKTAIDCGITHFDVAPYYGSGDAERILGDILSTCSDQVTITTKYGLVPIGGGVGRSMLRALLRPVFRRMSSLKKIASSVVSKTHQPKPVAFEKGALTASMNESIKKLRRPVDIFLLHDAEIDFAQNPDLIEELLTVKSGGQTRFTGISGDSEIVLKMVSWRPDVYEVAQTENSLQSLAPVQELQALSAGVITHRAIQGGLKQLAALIDTRPMFKQIWLRETGIDPSNKEELANMLIELALAENRGGTVLFSTTNPERIKKVASVLSSPRLGEADYRNIRSIFNDVCIQPGLTA